MKAFYVDKRDSENGVHEVHESVCRALPVEPHRLFLGYYSGLREAIIASRHIYEKSAGCETCSTRVVPD